jgi:hypothetical protein
LQHVIYGATTFGFEWKFLKYQNNLALVDTQIYYLNELPQLAHHLPKPTIPKPMNGCASRRLSGQAVRFSRTDTYYFGGL